MFKKKLFFLTLMLFLAACVPAPQPTPDNVIVPAPTEIPTQIPAAQTEMCPAATADLKLMVSTKGGFCLLYPAEFTWDGWIIALNPNGLAGDMPGDVWLLISISEAEGQTAAQIADAQIAQVGEGFNITRTELTIDGKQAILVDGLPAQDSSRYVYIVNNDQLYRFEFMPWFPSNDSSQPTPLESLYTTVVETLHFME